LHRAETSEHRGKKPIATGKVPGILKPVGFRPGSYSRAFEPFGKQAQREFDAAGADLRMQIKLQDARMRLEPRVPRSQG